MPETKSQQRVAYSPGEFAKLFGKSQTWGYRQIYAGKVTAITEHGRILIPAKEVERVLESAGIYNGKEKPKQAAARVSKLPPEQKSVWQRFMDSRRQGGLPLLKAAPSMPQNGRERAGRPGASRDAILSKIKNSWSSSRREKR